MTRRAMTRGPGAAAASDSAASGGLGSSTRTPRLKWAVHTARSTAIPSATPTPPRATGATEETPQLPFSMTDPDTTTDTTTEEQRHVERLRLLFKALEHEYDAIAHDPEERVPRIRLSADDEDGLADAASRAVEVFGGFVAGPFDAPEACYVEAHIADPPADVEGPTGVEYRLDREWFPDDPDDVDPAALEETIHDTEVLLP